MSKAPFRRIVTGHDARGRAVILEDGPPPRVARIGGEHGPLFFEVWNTRETPARIDRASGEPPEESIQLAPPEEWHAHPGTGSAARGPQHRQADARAVACAFRRGRRRRCRLARGQRFEARLHAPHRNHRLRHRAGRRDHPDPRRRRNRGACRRHRDPARHQPWLGQPSAPHPAASPSSSSTASTTRTWRDEARDHPRRHDGRPSRRRGTRTCGAWWQRKA